MSGFSVSPTQKKIRKVTIGRGGTGVKALRQTLDIVYEDLPAAVIREQMIGITNYVTGFQVKQGNPPTRMFVDGREGKQLVDVKKNIEVIYGDTFDRAIFDLVEKTLIQHVGIYARSKPFPQWYVDLEMLNGWEGRVGNINNWVWTYVPPRTGTKVGNRGISVDVDPRDKNFSFPFGSAMILKPRTSNPEVGLTNRRADWMIDTRAPKSKGGETGVRISGRAATRRGYLAMTTKALKRSQLGRNYTIWAGYTKKFTNGNERWMPDWMTKVKTDTGLDKLTPYILVMAKKKQTGTRKGYQSDAAITRKIKQQEAEARRRRASL